MTSKGLLVKPHKLHLYLETSSTFLTSSEVNIEHYNLCDNRTVDLKKCYQKKKAVEETHTFEKYLIKYLIITDL